MRRKSESHACTPSSRPSPYVPRAQPASVRSFPDSGAGIGGPPKRRESMSGIGNNLRSHNHVGLGRGVGRYKSASPEQGPSGIANLLRRRSSCATNAPQSVNRKSLPTCSQRRRGSVNTAAPVTADTLTHYSKSTVFPMNHTVMSDTLLPQRPIRRCTTLAIRRATDDAPLPVDHLERQRNDNTGDSSGRPDRRRGWSSSNSPNSYVEIGMTVGSPKSGKIVDVVGSLNNPSILYAPVRKNSHIGGADKGKTTMQQCHGIGGAFGKDWMADRPSGIGASVPQNSHPETGISKALKALGIKKNKKKPSEPDHFLII
ncbi:hypothetical protein EV178_000611 [Coemansia sp. RSA 1646]|nr:hypothetical protein EV178_000611 [Coemansia sp. RSA 1646]